MSFYVRKSLKAGPFRFNLSKSGLGISAGVPGFRVGLIGPRGHYIQAGRGGLYYRRSLNGGHAQRPQHRASHTGGWRPTTPPLQVALPTASDVVMKDETGATILALATAAPSDMVTQMTEAQHRHRLAPWVALVAMLLSLLLPPAAPILLIVGAVAFFYAHQYDKARRAVVAFYDVEDDLAVAYGGLVTAFGSLTSSKRASQIVEQGAITTTRAYKMNSGAGSLVKTTDLALRLQGPKVLVTNISVPSLETSHRAVYLLPDRVLLREGKTFADIPYASCRIEVRQGPFIEGGRPPSDAAVIGQTWQYVNKKGGPDRRFKNNRTLAITQNAYVTFISGSGLRCVWQFSGVGAAQGMVQALQTVATARAHTPTAAIA